MRLSIGNNPLVGRLYFADGPRGRGPIQKDRDARPFPFVAVAQGMEVTVGKERGGVALTLALTLKVGSILQTVRAYADLYKRIGMRVTPFQL